MKPPVVAYRWALTGLRRLDEGLDHGLFPLRDVFCDRALFLLWLPLFLLLILLMRRLRLAAASAAVAAAATGTCAVNGSNVAGAAGAAGECDV